MKKSLAIFHLNDERTIKGGERQMFYLAFQLRAMGHWNCIACRKDSAVDKAAESAGFHRLYLPYLFEWDPVSALLLRREMISAAGRSAGKVVLHAHTGHAASVAYVAALGADCARITHRREDFPLSNSVSINAKYASADKIIAVSDSIKKILADSGIPPDKIVTVHDCVPSSGFPWDETGLDAYRAAARAKLCRELDIPENAPCSGALIALVPHKDPLNYVRAARLVLEEMPEAHFILSGEGPLRDEVRRAVAELGLPHRLHLLAHHENPLDLMAALDIFVLPSWGEGMGSSLLEAMTAGTPVVATRVGGVPEVVEDGKSGLLVNPRAPKELARAQLMLFKNPRLRQALKETGFKTRLKFLSEDTARRITEIYAGH